MRTFKWAYGTAPLAIDPKMNVQLAANLIRSWRKAGYTVTRETRGLIRCQCGDMTAWMAFSRKSMG